MITPESASPTTIGRLPPRSLRQRASRPVRWLATRGLVHVLLLAATAGCVYPLAWMIMTSVKTDEELGENAAMPRLPSFRGSSPYVRDEAPIAVPDDVEPRRFRAILPQLRDATTSTVEAALPRRASPPVDSRRWASSAAAALTNRALAQLPRQTCSEAPH